MNELMYSFRDNNVRVVMKDNEPWFLAKEVCEILEINNVSQAIARIKDKNKGIITEYTLGGNQNLLTINESGLYEIIFTSRKEKAIDFKDWVFEEVLPSVRKNGIYATEDFTKKALSDPQFLIDALTLLKEEQEARKDAEGKLIEAKPKVLFAEAVGEADNTISVNCLAKLIAQNGHSIGQKRLFVWLRENGYLILKPGNDYNTPKQQYIEQGLFRIKEGVTVTSSGTKVSKTTMVTGKGQQYFVNKFIN